MVEKKISPLPLEVSPLIKLARWSCLISGVIYGFIKRRKDATMEEVLREKEEAERPAKEAFLAREKIHLNAVEMKELEEIFLGTTSFQKEMNSMNDNNREV